MDYDTRALLAANPDCVVAASGVDNDALVAERQTVEAIANLVSKHVAAERSRCRELCEQRAELWRNTESGKSPLAQEARFRANEAIYLADLLH